MKQKNVNTWEEFEQELAGLRRDGARTSTSLLFRGQENSDWILQTTLDRKKERMLFRDYYRLISRIRPQIESLTDCEWPMPEYSEMEKLTQDYDEFDRVIWGGPRPAYAYMAYLRHHGFPSPLLDWTRSPYVAAYFAFSKAAENSSGTVSIYAFSEVANKMHGNDMPVVYRYGPVVKTHRRHVLQQSDYTLCVAFDKEWRFENHAKVFDEGRHQQGVCWKFTIPACERIKVLRMLDEHDLNAFSLFGSEDAMMETLSTREFYFAKNARENFQVKAQRALSRMRRQAARRGLERLSGSPIDAEIRAARSRRKPA